MLVFEKDFSEIAIKGRGSMGNILTKADVHKISLKQKGSSTLGGRQVWFDWDVLRLNYDGRGDELGEFQSDDVILVVLRNGDFYTTNFDLSNHYEDNIQIIEKFDANKVWTAALYDADQKYPYMKRFQLEAGSRKQNFLGDQPEEPLAVAYRRNVSAYRGGIRWSRRFPRTSCAGCRRVYRCERLQSERQTYHYL